MGEYPKSGALPKWSTLPFEEYRANRIASCLTHLVNPGETVLDCGCGSLLIGQRLQDHSRARVFGSDVINLNRTSLALCQCPGEHLAFATQSVDVVCLIFVLHHTRDPETTLRESLRVARRRVIIMEDVFVNRVERELLRALDWLGNRTISGEMSMPFEFKSEAEWTQLFARLGARLCSIEPIRPVPWRPSRHRVFVLETPYRRQLFVP